MTLFRRPLGAFTVAVAGRAYASRESVRLGMGAQANTSASSLDIGQRSVTDETRRMATTEP